MRASLENIWSWLISASLWSAWFPNATNVSVCNETNELAIGTHFRWKQSGVSLESVVKECIPGRRLAWFARSPLITAYHAWDLQSNGDAVEVITDETQRGMMPALLGSLLKPRMLAVHDLWLERLEHQAITGPARFDRADC